MRLCGFGRLFWESPYSSTILWGFTSKPPKPQSRTMHGDWQWPDAEWRWPDVPLGWPDPDPLSWPDDSLLQWRDAPWSWPDPAEWQWPDPDPDPAGRMRE